eukprot:g3895.t1
MGLVEIPLDTLLVGDGMCSGGEMANWYDLRKEVPRDRVHGALHVSLRGLRSINSNTTSKEVNLSVSKDQSMVGKRSNRKNTTKANERELTGKTKSRYLKRRSKAVIHNEKLDWSNVKSRTDCHRKVSRRPHDDNNIDEEAKLALQQYERNRWTPTSSPNRSRSKRRVRRGKKGKRERKKMEKLRHKLRARAYGAGGHTFSLSSEFLTVDTDHSGLLDIDEFVYCIRRLVPLTVDEAKDIFCEVDVDENGAIEWSEFLAFVEPDGKGSPNYDAPGITAWSEDVSNHSPHKYASKIGRSMTKSNQISDSYPPPLDLHRLEDVFSETESGFFGDFKTTLFKREGKSDIPRLDEVPEHPLDVRQSELRKLREEYKRQYDLLFGNK